MIRLSALGDVLMMIPLVRTLQTHLPSAKLTWVISPLAYELVKEMTDVEFIVIDKPNGMMDYWRFKKQLGRRRFDVLLAAQSSFRANLLYPLIRADRKIGYDSLRAKDGHNWLIHETISPGQDHTLDGFLKFAQALGVKQREIRWDLPIQQEARVWAKMQLPDPLKGPIVVVNPAASKAERSWPADRYVEVLRYVIKKWQAHLILTGGPSEHDQALSAEIAKAVPVTNLVGKTKPQQLLALIAAADVVLCPDTGPSHMGAAMGTPVIALHAVTSADVSGPYIYRHLAVDCYPEAVTTILNRTRETTPWGTHAHGEDTMKLVSVAAVIAKFERVLGKEGP